MHKKELLKALHSIKEGVRPNADWKKSNRGILVSQITAQTHVEVSGERGNVFVSSVQIMRFVAKPVMAIAVVVFVVLGSYTAGVSATKNSLPGDFFYPVKLTSERVQVNFAKNREEKAKLEIAFASKRLQEVKDVKKRSKTTSEDFTVPLKKFQENVVKAKDHLEQVKIENVQLALVLADSFDEQTAEFITFLNDEKGDTSQDSNNGKVKDEINEAISASRDTNTAAVTLIIRANSEGEGEGEESQTEIKEFIEDKLRQAEKNLEELNSKVDGLGELGEEGEENTNTDTNDTNEENTNTDTNDTNTSTDTTSGDTEDKGQITIEEAVETPGKAQELLEEAKGLLEEGQIEKAFEKITEADRIVFEADDAIDEVLSGNEDEENTNTDTNDTNEENTNTDTNDTNEGNTNTDTNDTNEGNTNTDTNDTNEENTNTDTNNTK